MNRLTRFFRGTLRNGLASLDREKHTEYIMKRIDFPSNNKVIIRRGNRTKKAEIMEEKS
jgi:hypothetical protein